ncbi:nucleotide sugar dehydrogenase [bacterium]|nr:nucleotide sugar dehydrogenase [bacterium]
MKQLAERIESREALIGVVGLGYVGLPLAELFARKGYKVLGFDVSSERAAMINRGKNYIDDVRDEDLKQAVDAGLLSATTDMSRLAECECLSICVPTPLGKTKEPDLSYIHAVVVELKKYARAGQLLVLESTTYPGTTDDEMAAPLLAGHPEWEIGRDIFIAFSPERVDPSNPVYKTENTPKVVGGCTPACTELARLLYSKVISPVHTVSSTMTAELVKLLENTYRNVNIAWANEFAMICRKLGVDVWEIIQAASTKPFGFQAFYPGPGLGGHCIPIDPQYLAWKMRALNFPSRMIEVSDQVNSGMPHYVVHLVMETLNEQAIALKGSNIACLGVAYKANVDDVRESPALDVMYELQKRGANISFHDPFVPSIQLGGQTMSSHVLTPDYLAGSDLVLVLTNHDGVDYQMVASHARQVVDTRNAMRGTSGGSIVRL